jgi:capsular polysaccharide transport system permease protein
MVDAGAIILKAEKLLQAPFPSALRVQLRVIGALMLREAMARFGRENIGFFWLMGEPLILTTGIIIVWSVAGLTHGHNVSVIPFALTGYSVLTLWRHIVNRSVNSFRDNAGLLYHRQIYFIDIIIARTLLSTVGTGTAFFVAYVPLYLLNFVDPIADPLLLVLAWLLLAWFSFSVGLCFAALTEISHVAEHFIQPFLYLTLPITGTFFMVDWLPKKYQDLSYYSPLIGINEMFRNGFWGNAIPTYWSVVDILAWCIPLTAVAIFLANKARSRIRSE